MRSSADEATLLGPIATEHRYEFPVDRPAVWALISDVDAYQGWWPWLRRFEAGGLAAGEEWRCEVQPPLPYAVRFRVLVDQVEASLEVWARIEGDVVGTALLTLEEHHDGCVAQLVSVLAPGTKILRIFSLLAPPVARFGHDWVLDSGARQFIARAVTPSLHE